MVLPIIDYGDVFYHNASIKLLNNLQIIQNQGLFYN